MFRSGFEGLEHTYADAWRLCPSALVCMDGLITHRDGKNQRKAERRGNVKVALTRVKNPSKSPFTKGDFLERTDFDETRGKRIADSNYCKAVITVGPRANIQS